MAIHAHGPLDKVSGKGISGKWISGGARLLVSLSMLGLVGLSMACTSTDPEAAEDLALSSDYSETPTEGDAAAQPEVVTAEQASADTASLDSLAIEDQAIEPVPQAEAETAAEAAPPVADPFVTDAQPATPATPEAPESSPVATSDLEAATAGADPFAIPAQPEMAGAEPIQQELEPSLEQPVADAADAVEQPAFDPLSAAPGEAAAAIEATEVTEVASQPDVAAQPEAAAWPTIAQEQESVPQPRSQKRSSTPTPSGDSLSYLVAPGDTLSEIASRIYGSVSEWRTIAQANGLEAPYLIYPGDTLSIPSFGTSDSFAQAYQNVPETTLTVQKGDTLFSIAQRLLGDGSAWKYVWKINESAIPDPNRLNPGQTLRFRDFRGIQAGM
jgi:nucleoid-associated protein YgaU